LTYVVHMDRRGDHRFVCEVIRVETYDFDKRTFESKCVYQKGGLQ
jgi:hypothetical protein